MGKGKKIAIGVVILFVGFFVMAAAASNDVQDPEIAETHSNIETLGVIEERTTVAPDKYEGLTDDQIERVKIVKETCDSNAYLSSSETLTNKRLEACVEKEQKLIEEYRSKTGAKYAGLTPEEIESVQQYRVECEEEEKNLPDGVYISCGQRELALIEEYRAKNTN